MRLSTLIATLTVALALPVAVVNAQRFVGYYGKTAGECSDYPSFEPSELPLDLYTHLNFAFALIDDKGELVMQHSDDAEIYKKVNALKLKKKELRTALTVGGWDMDMAHYSKMVSTAENRKKFIKNSMEFVRAHNFDGLDFDWEYPSDKLRGGHDNDPENLVAFLKEFRAAANAEVLKPGQSRLLLSIALPGGPYHGQYFLLPKLAPFVDWFNIMAYNLHGQWEDMVNCAAPLYDPALKTKYNGYSVADAAKSMAPATVDPKKFNLGLSLSGVTFTLKDKAQTKPGSPAMGPGKEGCQEKGAMAYFEAKKLANNLAIADVGAKLFDQYNRVVTQEPQMDPVGKCMYMVVDGDQWVGYDTPETFALKMEFAKKYGFGGISIWSMDSDDADHALTHSIHQSLTKGFIESSEVKGLDNSDPIPDEVGPDGTVAKNPAKKALSNAAPASIDISQTTFKVLASIAALVLIIA